MPPAPAPPWKPILAAHAAVAAVVLFVAFLPATGALAAGAVASANGCTISASGPQPCVVWGADVGDALAFWAVAPWLLFVTVPAAALALPVIAISAGVMISRANKTASRPGTE